MSKTGRANYRRGSRGTPKPERRIIVRSVRRDPPDLRKLSRAVIAMAPARRRSRGPRRHERHGRTRNRSDYRHRY